MIDGLVQIFHYNINLMLYNNKYYFLDIIYIYVRTVIYHQSITINSHMFLDFYERVKIYIKNILKINILKIFERKFQLINKLYINTTDNCYSHKISVHFYSFDP